MHVLLTGGSGLAGRAATKALLAAGHTVRLLQHRASVSPEPSCEVVGGSLTERADVDRALAGTDAVVHAAAFLGGDEAQLRAVNVLGSQHVFRAAAGAAVPVVFVSTAGAYAPTAPFLDRDEDHLLQSEIPYCRSKIEAEAVGRDVVGDALTILRPVTIYRTGPCPVLLALARLLAAQWPMPHNGGADTPADVVHADDLADAMVLALQPRAAAGAVGPRTYNVAGPEPVGFRALVEAVAQPHGVTPNWQPADSDAGFEEVTVLAATAPHTVSIARARRELGYAPRRRWLEEIPKVDAAAMLRES